MLTPSDCNHVIGADYCGEDGAIQTFTGKRFFPFDPDPKLIDILDIAHALVNQCRFGGHCAFHWSVAAHSCLVAMETGDLAGLLHDASEAYLPDVVRPLKKLPAFAAYRQAEERLQKMIAEKYGLPWPEPAHVKEADNIILTAEANVLMDNGWWKPELRLGKDGRDYRDMIMPVPTQQVVVGFLVAFQILGGQDDRSLLRAQRDRHV
jgi:hypothetical protein